MYCSIDIETTGLEPERHQILELGAVIWTDDDVMKCPFFHTLVIPNGDIIGQPYALQLNANLLNEIHLCNGMGEHIVGSRFKSWLQSHGAGHGKVVAIGKNYGSFDLQFLKRLVGWPKELFHYRSLDVGSMYATREGIPSLTSLLSDYDIPGEPHTALHDARVALAAVIEVMQ